jgi:hypothetical protein
MRLWRGGDSPAPPAGAARSTTSKHTNPSSRFLDIAHLLRPPAPAGAFAAWLRPAEESGALFPALSRMRQKKTICKAVLPQV